jgi:hypothetical protein
MLIISEPCVPPMFGDGSANSPKNKGYVLCPLSIAGQNELAEREEEYYLLNAHYLVE